MMVMVMMVMMKRVADEYTYNERDGTDTYIAHWQQLSTCYLTRQT